MYVRQATVFDVDLLAPLLDAYRQFYGQPADSDLSQSFLRSRFAHHESVIFISVDENIGVIGFVQLYPLFSSVRAVRTYLLNDLFVAVDARRRGVGRQLIATATQFARANGAASMTLQTAVDNFPAQSLYESLDWRRDARFCEYTLALSATTHAWAR